MDSVGFIMRICGIVLGCAGIILGIVGIFGGLTEWQVEIEFLVSGRIASEMFSGMYPISIYTSIFDIHNSKMGSFSQ